MLLDLRGFETRGERIRGIRAGIHARFAINRQQAAVLIGIAGDVVVVLAAVGVGGELLAPIFDPAHRMAAVHREPRETHFFRQQNALVAKTTADVGRDHADLAFVQAKAAGQSGTVDVRHLRRGMYDQLTQALVPVRHDTASFQRRRALSSRAQAPLDTDRCAPTHPVEVAVGVSVDSGLQKNVIAPVLVHERRARLARRQHVDYRGKFVKIDEYLRRQVLSFSARVGHAHGDHFADQAHFVASQHRLSGGLESLETGVGDDRFNADQVGQHEN